MTNYMEIIRKLIYNIGEYGPFELTIVTCFLLWNKGNLFYYYVVGIVLNIILNIVLKVSFQQPRPSDDIEKFNLAITNARSHLFNMVPFNIYGMPSGHAQSVVFSTVYIYLGLGLGLGLKNIRILLFYLFISCITLWQRVKYGYHTVLQIVVGCTVGGLFAHAIFQLAKSNKMGIIKAKPDDNAPY